MQVRAAPYPPPHTESQIPTLRALPLSPPTLSLRCSHIDWHMAAGLVLTFISAADRLAIEGASFVNIPADMMDQCMADSTNMTDPNEHNGE